YKSYFTGANTGYACGDWGRCRYTTDGGFTWTNMSGALFNRSIHFFDIKAKGNAVYMTGNSNYLWRSTNLGFTWDSLEFISASALLPWSNYFYGIDFLTTSDTMIAVGSRGSIHQVLSSIRTPLSRYVKTGILRDIWASPSSGLIIAAGAPSSSGAVLTTHDQIMRSTNNGVIWSVITPAPNSTADFYSIDMIDENTGFTCGTKSAVYKTTNGGANWDSLAISNMPGGLTLSEVDFVNAQTGWIFSRYLTGYDSTIYKTTNGGGNWFKQKLNTSVNSENSVFAACMVDANNGWLLNSKPRPWKTTNGGASWDSTKLGDNYLAGSLYDIKMYDAMTGYCCGSNNKVYKTTNGGATPWTNTGYSSTTIITNYTCEVRSPLECVVMGTYGTVYYTTNGGGSWTKNNPGGSINDIYGSYLTPDGKLYAVTLLESNIFKNTVMFSVGINGPGILLPEKYELMQNFPNPFNPSTTIKFTLPKAGYATLKLYDVSGRDVMSVFANQYMTAGVHEHLFWGSKLASGIYFYSLIVDDKYIGTRKMVLIK
ncbi:MAG: YCF48-related protein, partial [Ignavibacteria bacterium]|nr:YCF48-related protein [Ignavibacteria bacterium]